MTIMSLNLGFRTNDNASFTGLECVFNSLIAMNYTTSREIGGDDIFHQSLGVDFRVLKNCKTCINRLGEVVWSHIGRHTHRDTRCSIDKKIRETSG